MRCITIIKVIDSTRTSPTLFPGVVTVGEMLRNKTAFIADVQKHMDLDPAFLHTFLETPVPNNNLEVSWRCKMFFFCFVFLASSVESLK